MPGNDEGKADIESGLALGDICFQEKTLNNPTFYRIGAKIYLNVLR